MDLPPLLAVSSRIENDGSTEYIFIRDVIGAFRLDEFFQRKLGLLWPPNIGPINSWTFNVADVNTICRSSMFMANSLTNELRVLYAGITRLHDGRAYITDEGRIHMITVGGVAPGKVWDDLNLNEQRYLSSLMCALSYSTRSGSPSPRVLLGAQQLLAEYVLGANRNTFATYMPLSILTQHGTWDLTKSPGYSYVSTSHDNVWALGAATGFHPIEAEYEHLKKFTLITHALSYGDLEVITEKIPQEPGRVNTYYRFSYPRGALPDVYGGKAVRLVNDTKAAWINTLITLATLCFWDNSEFLSRFLVYDWEENIPVLLGE